MFLFASLLLSTSLAFAPFDASAALDSPYRHVRSQDRSVRQLLKRGFTHSTTFRNLMARLEHSDVIVYIEQMPRLPGALEGRMMILPNAHGQRYVRIQLAMRGAPDDSVATLGHDALHEVAFAEHPDDGGAFAHRDRANMRPGHDARCLTHAHVGRNLRSLVG